MEICETTKRNVFFSFRKTTRYTFFVFSFFSSVSWNDRNSAKQEPDPYSFVFRETKKIIRTVTVNPNNTPSFDDYFCIIYNYQDLDWEVAGGEVLDEVLLLGWDGELDVRQEVAVGRLHEESAQLALEGPTALPKLILQLNIIQTIVAFPDKTTVTSSCKLQLLKHKFCYKLWIRIRI